MSDHVPLHGAIYVPHLAEDEADAREAHFRNLLIAERTAIVSKGHITLRQRHHCTDCAMLFLIEQALRR